MDLHLTNLKSMCRICGNKIKFVKSIKPKQVSEVSILVQYLGIDVERDIVNIYPQCICDSCRKILGNIKSSIKQGRQYSLSVKVFHIIEHSDVDCCVYSKSLIPAVGRKPALKQLNQYSFNSKKYYPGINLLVRTFERNRK